MANKSFSLSVGTSNQTMPDGRTVSVWGFSSGGGMMGGSVAVPAPTLVVNEGDNVSVTLSNMTMNSHTIHFHGLDTNTQNDGVPDTSFAVNPMGSYTYNFVASHAGTYFYHCHVNTVLHQQMGMYGPFIVKPADGSNRAWTGGPAYTKEYTWVLSEYDSAWHANPSGTNFAYYNPNYFLINGKADPNPSSDTKTAVSVLTSQTVLIRLINAGYLIQRVTLGGLSFQVIASDGRPLAAAETATSVTLAPGERYDLLLTSSTQATKTATVEYLNWYGQTVRGTAHTSIKFS